jgi:hypothetical protein
VLASSNPAGAWISVSCECCVLSGRRLCLRVRIPPAHGYLSLVNVVCCQVGVSASG